MSTKTELTVIIGPTSSGKTTKAIEICKKNGGEIISADSRQIYKYMDIGTGKVPMTNEHKVVPGDEYWVIDGVKIWGYDLVKPGEYFSAYDYALFSLQKIREVLNEGKPVFLVGGTGFYVDVVLGNKKIDGVSPNFELRDELEQKTAEQLSPILMSLNHEVAENIDLNNKVRLIRAIEKEMSKNSDATPLLYLNKQEIEIRIIGLTGARETLYSRVDSWAEEIWANGDHKKGILAETKRLYELGFANTPQMQGLIYKTALQHLGLEEKSQQDEEKLKEGALQRIQYELHAYIRRQQTYFKKMPNIEWIDIHQQIM